MQEVLDDRLWQAIEKNMGWIKKRCSFDERHPQKCEDLVQEIMFHLVDSNSSFLKQKEIVPEAWVKRITINRIKAHQGKEINRAKLATFDEYYEENHPESRQAGANEAKQIVHALEGYLKAEEQEIFKLMILGESVKDIADIVGMTPGSVSNAKARITKKAQEYINRGLNE